MPNTSSKKRNGDLLEIAIRYHFEALIAADRFWAKKDCCKVRWKPKYFSKDRNADITFDVSIELFMPGSDEPSSIVLIECKNYTHPVPVDDIEEFFAKVQQVAAAKSKGILASTASFQHGTREFAKSKGIALFRFFDQSNCKWELTRSPSAINRAPAPDDSQTIENGLSQLDFQSHVFDLYMQSPMRVTNSLWDFLDDLFRDSGLSPGEMRPILNSRSKIASVVPFLEKDELESRAAEILTTISYSGGELDLSALCLIEKNRVGMIVTTNAIPRLTSSQAPVLGRITFDPLVIEVYRQEEVNRGRERFTLSHELAHHFLHHGEHLKSEICDNSDFTLHRRSVETGMDVARMEFQANFFASCLLMPRQYFFDAFYGTIRKLGIPNRGFGALYVDNQPCNIQSLNLVLADLAGLFGVSRIAVQIRLETLGLLREHRGAVHISKALEYPDSFQFK